MSLRDVGTILLNFRDQAGVEYAMGDIAPAPLPCQVVVPDKTPAEHLSRRGERCVTTLLPRPPPGRPPWPPWQL